MYRRIRDLREDHDGKQETLAKLLGVSQATYSRYEQGTIEIPVRHIAALAAYYGTSTDYILGLTDEPRPYPRRRRRQTDKGGR